MKLKWLAPHARLYQTKYFKSWRQTSSLLRSGKYFIRSVILYAPSLYWRKNIHLVDLKWIANDLKKMMRNQIPKKYIRGWCRRIYNSKTLIFIAKGKHKEDLLLERLNHRFFLANCPGSVGRSIWVISLRKKLSLL